MEPYFYVDAKLLQERKKKKRVPRIVISFLLLLAITGGLIFFLLPRPQNSQASIAAEITPEPTQQEVQIAAKEGSLEESVAKALEDSHAKYGVYIKHLDTGETYEMNSHEKFDTASLYKLWVMGQAYKQIEDGSLTKETKLSQDVTVLNRKFGIASGSAELSEGRVNRTIEDALFRMITYSDNYSALILTEKLKLSVLTQFLEENGLGESAVGTKGQDPYTTAYDAALFLEKLYKGQLANSENSEEMIDLLKKQTINGKLPRYLPDDAIIAHKTGELGSVSHDAGIIYTPKGDYIIVVMSEGNSKAGADERIADISKNVYDYFTQ